MVIAEYKFNNSTNTFPTFNYGYTYTYEDVVEGEITTRTIYSDSLPATINFISSSITELIYLDISNITDFTDMFHDCNNLVTVNASDWDTSRVTSMQSMFNFCHKLTNIDVSNWDTGNVTNMNIMFGWCYGLTSLDLSKWNTSKVTDMSEMFYGCINLTTLNLSNFDTSSVTAMDSMFRNCSSLTSLDVSNFDTSKVTTMYGMFYNCSSLTSLDVSNFDTSSVNTMKNMFDNCTNLTSLDVSNFDTSSVTTMDSMFIECASLTKIKGIENWNTSNVTSMFGMFNSGTYTSMSLEYLDLSGWDTSKVTYMYQMFRSCNNLKYLDISNFKINSNCNTNGMFEVYGIENIGMLHCDSYTVNAVAKNMYGDSTIWVQDTKAYEYEDTNNNGIITFRDYKEQEIKIDLPQPLRKIGDYKDRLYWDEEKGRYCIEQIIGKGNLSDATSVNSVSGGWSNDEYYAFNVFFPYNVVSKTGQYEITMISEDFISSTEINAYRYLEYEEFLICRPHSTVIKLAVSRGDINTYNDYMLNYIKSLNTTFYWVMNDPIVIETDITEKLNFDTYNESMYITTDELEVAPSSISAEISMKEKLRLPVITLRPSSFNGMTWINEATQEPFNLLGTLTYNEAENCIVQGSKGSLQIANPLRGISDYTISFKYTSTATNWENAVFSTHSGKGNGISIIPYTKSTYMALYNAGEKGDGQKDVAVPTFVNPTTYFYTLVFSTGQVKLYLNGQYYSTITLNVNASTSDVLTIGSRHAADGSSGSSSLLNHFTGKLHFLEVYDMHLTDEEIYQNYLKNN